ncbi:hypothetical protein PHLGIDRAFT_17251 [Phlebiopsis gigantea 11061_1 CR5-6]|uniref:Uncharacterized protein n=1 Tax=Phlebiopsis gigantea (strain 11061_1 CR5-6) TaxID=745531 RepID=A0A0C3S1K1_PHLG1|nr:hypothetical protein PHLGIDRAFT_17251 [Phlebiopsis gigantea 11061_1 CR5-6]
MKDMLSIIDGAQWEMLKCPAPWAQPLSTIYTIHDLHADMVARLRVQLGRRAFEPEAGEPLAKLAAAYCVMRISNDIAWKLFAELFINTAPGSPEGLIRSVKTIAVFMRKEFPDLAIALHTLYTLQPPKTSVEGDQSTEQEVREGKKRKAKAPSKKKKKQ